MATKETERTRKPAPAEPKTAQRPSRKAAPEKARRPVSAGKKARPAAAKAAKEVAPVRRPSRAAATERSVAKQEIPAATAVKDVPEKKQVKPAQEIVYLPPKPFQRNRLVMQLLTVVAIVLAVVLGISVFFEVDVEKTAISGCEKYTTGDVLKASGIKDGDHLLTFSRTQIAGRIISKLPYVEEVRIGIKLPDTVTIQISEVKVLYAMQAQDDAWWLVSAGGKVVEACPDGGQSGYTKIHGVRLDQPEVGQQGVALEDQEPELDEEGNALPVTVTQAMRMSTAFAMIENLELNGILGKIDNMDVSDLSSLQLWYGQQYQVYLGSDSQLSYKISCLKSAVDQLDSYQSGSLDISFTTWPNQVGYTPFTSGETAILPNN